jgi:23S rRNA (guanosine2251-2'-O)-methyltransferase
MNELRFRLILSDIRSAGNVGAILRTADACGVELIYACGYTPYPQIQSDERPAHITLSNTRAIAKTALGAELTVPVLHIPGTTTAIMEAKHDGFEIIVIEQTESSLNLFGFRPKSRRLAIVVGNEVGGVSPAICALAGVILELPMVGSKESLNVASAAAVALYQLRFGQPH